MVRERLGVGTLPVNCNRVSITQRLRQNLLIATPCRVRTT